MKRYSFLFGLLLLLAHGAAHAVIETYEFTDEQLEQRYHELSQELRCPKCQNQNIADSNAPISQDLRKSLYEQLEGGASDEEILDYMVQRYGEFVRYRPRFDGMTSVLWLAPVLLLAAAIVVAVLALRGRRGTPGAADLNEDEQARLRELLEKAEEDSTP